MRQEAFGFRDEFLIERFEDEDVLLSESCGPWWGDIRFGVVDVEVDWDSAAELALIEEEKRGRLGRTRRYL